jgi:hypothetical protein
MTLELSEEVVGTAFLRSHCYATFWADFLLF